MTAPASAAKTHIAPFALFIALLAAADLLDPSAKYWVLPVRAVVCGLLIIIFWSSYGFKAPVKTVFTLFIAVLVLLLWISPQHFLGFPKRLDGFDPTAFKDRPQLFYPLLAVRFLQLAVVVPFIEEIFWRGFLLRYFVREDFESVPFGTFTWPSFLIVSVAFCFEHRFPDWPAAFVTGILYNLIAVRTRSLSSCVLAHAVTNLLLGIYIMRTGQWGFW